MANVTFIPAKRQVGNNIKKAEKPKLRVAAYCRVSTDSDEQATSYDAQIEHYTEYISKNPDWVLAGIFADDGITGTNTKKRDEFNRMIDECHAGNIDMIITKSISRFARNTLDCLKYIRELKDKNIPVFFEKESINTMDSKGEVLLTIMASLAQQESQSLSQNVKMGIQYRYQQGKVQVNHNRFLGYTKDADGNLVIEPKQAEIVKRIYREYLEGKSMDKIAAGLEADGILTGAGKERWHPSTIKKILTNEKYIGDALLQKTYTTDFLTKKRIKNNGTMPQYYVEGDHEAIIPKDIFLLVQEELARRRRVHTTENGKRRCYSCKHCFAQIVFCGECGEYYRRVHWNNRGCRSIVWRCCSRLENTGHACRSRTVNETILEQVVIEAINQVLCQKNDFLKTLQANMKTTISDQSTLSPEVIDTRLRDLQKELLKKANQSADYDAIADEILCAR
jgi:site-specific DNA recombinase